MVDGILAMVIGYLLGSIPTAFIVTRIAAGKDIRRLGNGNVGGLNVFREVGPVPAIFVALGDLGKGAASVAIAHWLLSLPPLLVMLTGLAAIAGHMWMLFLKFAGGKGMGATFGVLFVLMPLYGHWYGILIFIAIIGVVFLVTRNVGISMGTGLLFLPVIVWLMSSAIMPVLLALATGVIIGIKYMPTFRLGWDRNQNIKDFVYDRWQKQQNDRRQRR